MMRTTANLSRRSKPARALALGAAAMMGMAVLAGCSSTSTDQPSSEPSAQTGGSQVLPPVIVEQGQTTASAKVGDSLYINVEDPVTTTISTSTPDLVEVIQGYSDGSAVFNPGAKVLAAGEAVITIQPASGAAYDLKVSISQ